MEFSKSPQSSMNMFSAPAELRVGWGRWVGVQRVIVDIDGCKCFTPAYRFSAESACTYLPTVWSVFVIRSSNNSSNDLH